MALDLVYFAWVREAIGKDGESIEPPERITTVAELIAWLEQRGGGYAQALGKLDRLRAAVDQRFVAMDAPIVGAKEIAIFPPVTGG